MPTDKKSINAYNKYAKDWARSKRDGSAKYHIYLEKPAIYGALPNLHGKTVLCIGCGSGEEVEHLYSLGAKKVIGIDISQELISVAKKSYPNYEFYVMDMEKLNFKPNSFDLAFSSLVMHYVDDWTKVLTGLRKILKKDGIYVFSVVHPFFSAIEKYEDAEVKSRLMGYVRDKVNNKFKIYGNYFKHTKYNVIVNQVMEVTNWSRPLQSIIKDIVKNGFELIDLVEPRAVKEAKSIDLEFWEVHQRIPDFIIYKIRNIKS